MAANASPNSYDELREARKQWFAPMEQKLKEIHTMMMPQLMKMVESEMERMRR